MKHLVFACYIASVLYCYLQLNMMIERCIERFMERHPSLPMENDAFSWNGLKLTMELILISAIPVANIALAMFCAQMGEGLINEIINNVEINHINEIRDFEKAAEEIMKCKDECCNCSNNCGCGCETKE